MKKIRISIIGASGTANKRIAPALQNSELCVITSIQGRDYNHIIEIKEQFKIEEAYTDINEMLSQGNYDCIYIATPPFLHFQNILIASKTNKPIICEKPLARNYAEGIHISKILNSYNDTNLRIAHHLRHQKAIKYIAQWINQKVIGDILNVVIQWGYEMNLYSKNAAWKKKPELQGLGSLSDNGIHLIDLIIYLFGLPKYIWGKIDNINMTDTFDNETSVLTYEKTCIYIQSSQCMKYSGNHLLIYGTQGSIEAFYSVGEESITQIVLRTVNGNENFNYPTENLYKNEIEDFCKTINDPFYHNIGTTLKESLMALKIIDKIRQSAFSNKVIKY